MRQELAHSRSLSWGNRVHCSSLRCLSAGLLKNTLGILEAAEEYFLLLILERRGGAMTLSVKMMVLTLMSM